VNEESTRKCLRQVEHIHGHLWHRYSSGAGTAYPSGTPEFTPVFSGVRVTRSLALCVCFVDRYLSFCPFFLVIVLSVLRLWMRKEPGRVYDKWNTSCEMWCWVRRYLKLFVGGCMSYLRYLCLFACSGVQRILCCVVF
jgi:hypothetical protein